ncbi:MAG: helix-turn-helix domain-containing protein [Thiobacillus sp.]
MYTKVMKVYRKNINLNVLQEQWRFNSNLEPLILDLRKRLGLTQEKFAARFGFSVATLRHWERGDRTPHGPALVLLNLIDREPQAVMRALAA